MTPDELLEHGRRALRAASKNRSTGGVEAEESATLLEHALGHKPRRRETVTPAARRRFEDFVSRRAAGEPIPYILGYTEFRGLRMAVRPGVFVPRDTSDFLATLAIRRLRARAKPVALDLATGIGPVALAIAHDVPRAEVWATDLAPQPVAQGRRNARALGLRVHFRCGDMFDSLPRAIHGRADTITIHPPYVPAGEVHELPAELKEFEPVESLTDGSDDGLGLVRRVVNEGPRWLRRGGWVLIEIDASATRSVRSLLTRGGFTQVRSLVDRTFPLDRVVVGRLA